MSGDEEVVYDWGRRGDNVSWNRYVRQYVVVV